MTSPYTNADRNIRKAWILKWCMVEFFQDKQNSFELNSQAAFAVNLTNYSNEKRSPLKKFKKQITTSEVVEVGHISGINGNNKSSAEYRPCVGVILTGVDKISGEPLSCLMHLNPFMLYPHENFPQKEKWETFMKKLNKDLERFFEAINQASFDAYLFGGVKVAQNLYDQFSHDISGVIQNVTHKSPKVIANPAPEGGGSTSVFVDTKKKKIHIARFVPKKI